jgi:hypothetical protein
MAAVALIASAAIVVSRPARAEEPQASSPRVDQKDNDSGHAHAYLRAERHIHVAMVIGGASTFSACYLLGVGVAATANENGPDWARQFRPLYVPVFGPLLALHTLPSRPVTTVFMLQASLSQIGALAFAIAGGSRPASSPNADHARVWHTLSLGPLVLAGGGTGIAVSGSM